MADESEVPAKRSEAANDAAAMASRMLSIKGDSDNYEEPLKTLGPPTKKKPVAVAKGASRVKTFVGAILILAAGTAIGSRVEKRRHNPIVATINGESITADDFAHAAEVPSGRQTLQRLLDEKLLMQFAKAKHVVPDQKAVDARYADQTKTPDFFKKLKESNQSPEDYKHALLVLMCRQAIVDNGIQVNDSDISDYYKKNTQPTNPQARYFHPETVLIQVIVTKSQDAINKAWQDIKSGTQFTAAVAKYSKDVSRSRNGVLPAIRKGTINATKFPGMDHLLFDGMSVGSTVEPKQFGDTFWIIHCLNHSAESTDSFEKVKDECRESVLFSKGMLTNGKELKKEEEQFVRKANIQIAWSQYSDMTPVHK